MMKQNKIIRTVVSILLFLPFIFFLKQASGKSKDDIVSEWLDRVEFSAQWETDKKPTLYFQTVQPLFQDETKTDTFFIQPRVSLRAGRTMYNLGLGYRRLVSDELILGLNVFGDYQDKSRHGRLGLGLEALGQVFEARMNSYFGGITETSNTEEPTNGAIFERVSDGLDLEFGAPLPYLPWLKIYGSGFWYDFKKLPDKHGWKTRLEAKLSNSARLEFYTWDDNKGDMEFGGQLRFNVAFNSWNDIWESFKFSREMFPEKDLTKELLIPVERHHDIVVEKYQETGTGLTVEAGRS